MTYIERVKASLDESNITGLNLIDRAVCQHDPTHVFALFSGGHDSLCSTHLASHHPRFTGVVHINTGIGVEETREFVRDTCRGFGWPLKEYRPPSGHTYEDIVRDHGMPGPGQHTTVYARLKERALRRLFRETKRGNNRILLVTGVRSSESTRRMGTVQPIRRGSSVCKQSGRVRDGRQVWVAPIHDMSDSDKELYMRLHDLPRNEVVGLLCMSGECLCGAFAKRGELQEIRAFFPAAAARIDRCMEIAKANGKPCIWGRRPQERTAIGQLPLCFSCEQKEERANA